MIRHSTNLIVSNATAEQFYDFMIKPNNNRYRAWWPEELQIKHELRIGFDGMGKVLNPFIRMYFTKSFTDALEMHCLEEWPRLAKYLMNSTTE